MAQLIAFSPAKDNQPCANSMTFNKKTDD